LTGKPKPSARRVKAVASCVALGYPKNAL